MKKDFVPGTDYIIYQNEDNFKYTTDSLLLSSFARARGLCVDLGSGNAILSLRLINKNSVKSFINVEKNKGSHENAILNIKENKLSNKISCLNIDVRNIKDYISHQSVDTVIMNPPYFSKSLKNNSKSIKDARHTDNLIEFINAASYILKNSGRLYIIIATNRLTDVFVMLRNKNIEPKRIRFIKKDAFSSPKTVLIESVKQGKSNLSVEKDFLLNSDELKKIYENEEI